MDAEVDIPWEILLLSRSALSQRNGEQEVPDDWMKASITSIFQEGNKEEPGNYWPVCLTIIPGKVVEQIIQKNITKHVQEMVIRNSQDGFTK